MIKVSPASREDLLRFYDKLDKSLRAWKIENETEILAIGGFAFHSYGLVFFSNIIKPTPKTIWLLSRKGLEEGLKYNMPMWAIRDLDVLSSERYLQRLGFKFSHINADNEEIYLWDKH